MKQEAYPIPLHFQYLLLFDLLFQQLLLLLQQFRFQFGGVFLGVERLAHFRLRGANFVGRRPGGFRRQRRSSFLRLVASFRRRLF